MSDKSLAQLIDLYNRGAVSEKTALALEIIDGCDGPGDEVVSCREGHTEEL
jgi:hypothetical protein